MLLSGDLSGGIFSRWNVNSSNGLYMLYHTVYLCLNLEPGTVRNANSSNGLFFVVSYLILMFDFWNLERLERNFKQWF